MLRELLRVVRRTAAFEHDRVAADADRQIADPAAEARFDPLADGDGEMAVALGADGPASPNAWSRIRRARG